MSLFCHSMKYFVIYLLQLSLKPEESVFMTVTCALFRDGETFLLDTVI